MGLDPVVDSLAEKTAHIEQRLAQIGTWKETEAKVADFHLRFQDLTGRLDRLASEKADTQKRSAVLEELGHGIAYLEAEEQRLKAGKRMLCESVEDLLEHDRQMERVLEQTGSYLECYRQYRSMYIRTALASAAVLVRECVERPRNIHMHKDIFSAAQLEGLQKIYLKGRQKKLFSVLTVLQDRKCRDSAYIYIIDSALQQELEYFMCVFGVREEDVFVQDGTFVEFIISCALRIRQTFRDRLVRADISKEKFSKCAAIFLYFYCDECAAQDGGE